MLTIHLIFTGSTSLMLFLNFELANNKRNNTKKEQITTWAPLDEESVI